MKNKLSFVASIALLLLVTGSSAFCLTYNMVEIPLPQNALGLQARGVNEVGQVVGDCHCYDGGEYSQAFIYENGVTTLLTGLGGRSSIAWAINDQSWAVGDAYTGQSYYNEYYENWFAIYHACIWQAGTITDLGTLGGYCSRATDVNNLGDIIGTSDTTAMGLRGFQISKPFIFTNGQMTDLNQLLPAASGWELDSAYSINDSRQIVGVGKYDGVDHCFFFDLGNGTISTITDSTGAYLDYYGRLNNSGTVTGGIIKNYQIHGLLWNPSTGSTDIPALPDYYHSIATDINNAGQAVGYSMDMYEEHYAAFLFQCGELISINSLIDPASGWNVTNARRISDAGWILAIASKPYTGSAVRILVPVIDSAATAKTTENGKPVSFREISVTAVFGDFFYIEATNRSCGIRVDCPGHTLQPGMAADVDGIIRTNEDGERYVDASRAVQNGEASVEPLGMPIKALGGGAWKTGVGGSGQVGVTGGVGLNNIGLLIRTWGILQQYTDGTYYLDDGSEPDVLLEIPAEFDKPVGQMVRLNGISSCRKDTSGDVHRLLRATAIDH